MRRLVQDLLSVALLLAAIDPAVHAAAGEVVELSDGVIRACVGHQGRLRLAGADGVCRPSETPTAWQQRGGVRVHDAAGRELGRYLPVDPVGGQAMVLHEQTGVRFPVSHVSGTFEGAFVSFTEPGCQGEALVPTTRDIGHGGSVGTLLSLSDRGQLFVVTAERVGEIPIRSQLDGRGRCAAVAPGSVLSDGLRVLPFAGELGFEFPVPLPLTYRVPVEVGEHDLVRACIGANGALRIPAAGSECRPGEALELWQRTGGLHVFDREGRDLGLLMVGSTDGHLLLFLPRAGVWLGVLAQTGLLAIQSLRFAESGCQGDAYVSLGQLAGLVFRAAHARPHELLVVTSRAVLLATRSQLQVDGSCVEGGGGQIRRHLAVEPYTGDLGIPFSGFFSLAGPLLIGFPGSPFADPGREGPDAGVLGACAGPNGRLRVVDSPADCRGQESHHAWSRRGGVRVLDGSDRDLGTLVLLRATVSVLDDASGLRFPLRFATGELGDETSNFAATRVSFTERDCRGIAFRYNSMGIVLPNVVSPTGLFAGMRQVVNSVPRSFATTAGPCVDQTGPLFSTTLLEPFEGDLPWAVPVELPLRLRAEIE